jgi:hypothetical protein
MTTLRQTQTSTVATATSVHLAGPEPDQQVFAKFKHLSRKTAERSSETINVTIGEILRAFYAHRMRHWLCPILETIIL